MKRHWAIVRNGNICSPLILYLEISLKGIDLRFSLHICGVMYMQGCLLQERVLRKDWKNLMPSSRRMIEKLYIHSVGCPTSIQKSERRCMNRCGKSPRYIFKAIIFFFWAGYLPFVLKIRWIYGFLCVIGLYMATFLRIRT